MRARLRAWQAARWTRVSAWGNDARDHFADAGENASVLITCSYHQYQILSAFSETTFFPSRLSADLHMLVSRESSVTFSAFAGC